MSLTPRQEYDRKYYLANKERLRAIHDKWGEENRDKMLQYQREYNGQRRDKQAQYVRRWRKDNAEYVRNKEKERAKMKPRILANLRYGREAVSKLKFETMQAYGGHCNCCGETQVEFLSLDHINNDGGRRRREGLDRVGKNFYFDLKKAGFPKRDDLQVLCYNCNFSKRYTGRCPHESHALRLIHGVA